MSITYVALALLHVVNKEAMAQCHIEKKTSRIPAQELHRTCIETTHKSVLNGSASRKTGICSLYEIFRSKRWMIGVPVVVAHAEKSLFQLSVDHTTRSIGVHV